MPIFSPHRGRNRYISRSKHHFRAADFGFMQIGVIAHGLFCCDVGDRSQISQISQIFFVWWCEVKRVIISLSEAAFWGGRWDTTPVASLPLCGANHKSESVS